MQGICLISFVLLAIASATPTNEQRNDESSGKRTVEESPESAATDQELAKLLVPVETYNNGAPSWCKIATGEVKAKDSAPTLTKAPELKKKFNEHLGVAGNEYVKSQDEYATQEERDVAYVVFLRNYEICVAMQVKAWPNPDLAGSMERKLIRFR